MWTQPLIASFHWYLREWPLLARVLLVSVLLPYFSADGFRKRGTMPALQSRRTA